MNRKRFQDQVESPQGVRSAVQVEVSLRQKLNKFTNAVNSCDFSTKHEYIVAAGRYDNKIYVYDCYLYIMNYIGTYTTTVGTTYIKNYGKW